MWSIILSIVVFVLIVIPALCNPRLWRDLKRGRGSMDDELKEGRDDLKTALRSKKQTKTDDE